MVGGSLVIHYEQTPGRNLKLCKGRNDIPLTPPTSLLQTMLYLESLPDRGRGCGGWGYWRKQP